MTKPAAKRKRRVRKHIIADLSRNHIEYKLLKAGHTMVVDPADYGYDGSITTFDSNGEIENGYVFIQLKATDHLDKLKKPLVCATRLASSILTFGMTSQCPFIWFCLMP